MTASPSIIARSNPGTSTGVAMSRAKTRPADRSSDTSSEPTAARLAIAASIHDKASSTVARCAKPRILTSAFGCGDESAAIRLFYQKLCQNRGEHMIVGRILRRNELLQRDRHFIHAIGGSSRMNAVNCRPELHGWL